MAVKRDLVRASGPYVRSPQANVKRMMYDVIIALMPVVLFSIYRYGLTAVGILAASLVSMVGTEYLYTRLKKEKNTIPNGTAIISAIIYAMIMPDAAALWIVFIGGVVAIFISKLAFGGMGANIFNVAGFGRVFVMLSFGALLTYNVADTVAGATVLGEINGSLDMGNASISIWNMMTGMNEVGSIGEVNVFAMLIGLVYLLIRRSADWRIPLTYLTTFIIMAFTAGIFAGNAVEYTLIHLFSGGVIFGAVFMLTDPITSPTTGPGRVYYAFGAAVLTFFIRIFGAYPEGVVFAILLMNMFVPAIDYYKWSHVRFSKRGIIVFSSIAVLSLLLLIVGVM